MSLRGKAAIVGIAELKPLRSTPDRTSLGILAEVARDAIDDAGLRKEDIDGIMVAITPEGGAGITAAFPEYIQIQPRVTQLVEIAGATAAGMVWRAAAAIDAGMANNVLCLTGGSSSPDIFRRRGQERPDQWQGHLGLMGANSQYAFLATRHAFEFGTTDEQRAKVAVDQRTNALANPTAFFYGQPLTINDVLNSRMVSDPLRILECVMPTAGAEAFVVTSAERARSLRHPPAYILGAGECTDHSSLTRASSLTTSVVKRAAAQAFAMAGVSPRDIKATEIYDCYTITVMITLEDAGFCRKGESGPFVQETDLTYKGKLPVNTHGGQLSFSQPPSHAGGMTQVVEGARQIMGRGGARQVPNCDLVYVNGNGGSMSYQCSIILGRQL